MSLNETATAGPPPLSTSKKRATVRRVFGDILESVSDSSLRYSTSVDGSPTRTDRSSTTTTYSDTPHDSDSKGVVVTKPFANILGTGGINKENAFDDVRAVPKPKEDGINLQTSVENDRKELLRRLRQQAQTSSQRSIMAMKAQDAVTKATKSVHRSVGATFNGTQKLQHAQQIHAETEQNRRALLKLQRELSSSFRKTQAEKQRAERLNQLETIEKESQFQSEVFRDHVKVQRDEKERKRRESVLTKAKMRENRRQGEQKLQLQRIQEDQAYFEERQLSFAASQEEKKRNAQDRRKSYQFRNGDARRIRELHSEMEALKLKAERDSYELKWSADNDAKEYQRQLAEKRRESLAARNAEARRQKELEEQQRSEQLAKEHESFELKWAGEKDAEQYKLETEQKRRESLAARNKERAQHAKVMDELNALSREREAESFMLKWAGENDAKEYLAKLARQRRESLQQRNREAKARRDMEEANRQRQLAEAHAEEALQSACQKDVEKFKKECADQRRASLEFRGKETVIQRLEEEQRLQKEREIEAANRDLEDQARRDVEEYLQECKQRRRLSLACRAKEWRRHVEWKEQQAFKLLEQQRIETQNRTLDYCNLERARQQERVRMVMDTLRHAGCNLDDQMFAHLLK